MAAVKSSVTRDLPPGWPRKRSLAVSLSVMLEGWSDRAAPGVGPMGNVLTPGVLDLQARSWAEYGPNAGAWRLLDVLGAARARAVFYVSGILAARYPELMRAIVVAGHPVAAHGWAQEIIPATQDEQSERADLARCLRALEAATGHPPRGWLSPRCTPSAHTAQLLAEAGLLWHADYFDYDLPRVLSTRSGPVTAVPFTMEVNDMPLSVRYGNAPEAFSGALKRILKHWPGLQARPACLDITVHAHVFGRPFGAIEFAHSIAAVQQDKHAFLTDHDTLGAMFSPAASGPA